MSELELRIEACKSLFEMRRSWDTLPPGAARISRMIDSRDTLIKQHEAAEDALDTCADDDKDDYLALCNSILKDIDRIERALSQMLGVEK